MMLKSFFKKEVIFIVTMLFSLFMFLPTFNRFDIKCSGQSNVFNSYSKDFSIEKEFCSEINYDTKPILYMYVGTYLFCIIFFLLFNKILNINHFFDKYLFNATLLAISIFIPSFTSFSHTKFYFYYSIFLFFVLFLFVFKSVENNYQNYKTLHRKIVYFLFFIFYCILVYATCIFYGFSRCVGGCL